MLLVCVAWRFLSNLKAIGKRESRAKERRSREEPGREVVCSRSNCLNRQATQATGLLKASRDAS